LLNHATTISFVYLKEYLASERVVRTKEVFFVSGCPFQLKNVNFSMGSFIRQFVVGKPTEAG